MKLLILGGTVFLGRHIVEAALARNHDITLFNRGQHNPDLFPGVEKLRGDRDGDLAALDGRRWDGVIDTCGYVPRVVEQSARLLAGQVEHYTFVSSLSVYADFSRPDQDETAPVATLDDPTVEEVTGETYGPLKALCEQAVLDALPRRACVVRPGLIVGPHDPTDRFTYWPQRVARGGDVLAPSRADYPIEFSDVRDLARWMVHLAESRSTGTFNASGPDQEITLGALLELSRDLSGSDARFIWVDEAFLRREGVQPWSEMPLWVGDDPAMAGFPRFDTGKARAAGLAYRVPEETVRDTLAWLQTRAPDHAWRAGISERREAELLAAWQAREDTAAG